MLEMEYSGFGGQYPACWCPGSYSRQSISSSHGIGCEGQKTSIAVPELISPTGVKPNTTYNSKFEYNLNYCSIIRALGGPGVRAPGPWKSNGAPVKFCLRAQWTPQIGELVMYFNGGTLQILLGALGNSNCGAPDPQQKMSTESPDDKELNKATVMTSTTWPGRCYFLVTHPQVICSETKT